MIGDKNKRTPKSKAKRVWLIIGSILAVIVGFVIYFMLCMNPYRGTVDNADYSLELDECLSAEEAREDLEYMMECLRERHPMWLENGNERVAAAEAQYVTESSAITEGYTVLQLYQAGARIAAKLQDGHTYPYWDGENLLYIHDFTQMQQLGRPLTINGIDAKAICEAYKEVASYELDFYIEEIFYQNAVILEYALRLCGVDTSQGVTMTFDSEGNIEEYVYQFVPIEEVKGYHHSNEEKPWVYYEIDRENNIGVFTLTTCVCDKEYREVLEDFFQEVLTEDIQNVVVDLRYNGGGNSLVANEFIEYLDVEEYKSWDSDIRIGDYLLKLHDITYNNKQKKQVFTGDVFVLTNKKTYSAAMDFAMLIADNKLGTIVGEPAGNLPDSYGDTLFFQMPNSKLVLCVSYKRWYRTDQSKSGLPIMPDYEVDSNRALEKVYELIQ